MTILPKAIYRFSAIPIKLPRTFFTELGQNIFKFVWKHKRPRIAKDNLKKKNGVEESGSRTSDYNTKQQLSKLHGTGTKTEIQISGRNRIESPEFNPHTYRQLIYDKGA